jgi:hypothetical protein
VSAELPYRYMMSFTVEVAGDGQHSDGKGAEATRRRLTGLLEADDRVKHVNAGPVHYAGKGSLPEDD